MAIYPDKKDGKLTGRFRVELQRGTERYRKRWDSYAEAQVDEARVMAAWDRGEAPTGVLAPVAATSVHTVASVTKVARGELWRNQSSEESAWAHMREMGRIFGENRSLEEVDTVVIDAIARELTSRGKQDTTVNRYLSHFRTFLVYARDRKWMSRTAFDEIKWAWRKETPGRIRWITRTEEAGMKAFLLSKGQEAMWHFIKVAIETGCRRSELLTAKLDQINGNRLHLWKTKTDQARTIPMSDATRTMLVDLIEAGTMPSKRGLRSWWDRMALQMGLDKDDDFVFHTCRHTCATRLLDAGVDILIIKEWLGHSRIETTLRYTHVKPKNLEAALLAVGELSSRAA
jgi:integrase